MLNRDEILSSNDLPKETVSVPEWGGDVIVQAMTGTDRDDFERSIYHDGIKDFDNVRAKLCARSIIDDKGEKVFSLSDVVELGQKNCKALDRVFAVAKRLSGVGSQEILALKKNLRTTR